MTSTEIKDKENQLEKITLAAGCFWCVEAVFEQLDGVVSATSGYMGGHTENPSYQDVVSGTTGHAEVVQLEFDPQRCALLKILELFWQAHDPTTLNRQGADVGTQYRSAIFVADEEQRKIATISRDQAQKEFEDKIVTEIEEAGTFYPAENYHHDFYRLNKRHPYCQAVIASKLRKLGMEA